MRYCPGYPFRGNTTSSDYFVLAALPSHSPLPAANPLFKRRIIIARRRAKVLTAFFPCIVILEDIAEKP
jgi:hypothetical protein